MVKLKTEFKKSIKRLIEEYEERSQHLREALEEDSEVSAYEAFNLSFPFNCWDVWSSMKEVLDRDPTQDEVVRVIQAATDPKRREYHWYLDLLVEDLLQSTPKNE